MFFIDLSEDGRNAPNVCLRSSTLSPPLWDEIFWGDIFSVPPSAFLLSSIDKGIGALTVEIIIPELTNVLVSIRVSKHTPSVGCVVSELTSVLISIGGRIGTLAAAFVISKLTGVVGSTGPGIGPHTIIPTNLVIVPRADSLSQTLGCNKKRGEAHPKSGKVD